MDRHITIIFDSGKVVFDISFDRTFQFLATVSGRQFDDIKSKFRFDELSDKFERGEISEGQFRAEVSQRMNLKFSDKDFDNGWCDIYLDTYNGIDNLLKDLKHIYKLVALTNTNIIHERVWKVSMLTLYDTLKKYFVHTKSRQESRRGKRIKLFLTTCR